MIRRFCWPGVFIIVGHSLHEVDRLDAIITDVFESTPQFSIITSVKRYVKLPNQGR